MNQSNRQGKQNFDRPAGGQLNMQPGEVRQAVESGKVDNLLGRLSADDANRVKEVLSDEKKTRELLNSPAAQALLKKFMNQQ